MTPLHIHALWSMGKLPHLKGTPLGKFLQDIDERMKRNRELSKAVPIGERAPIRIMPPNAR